MTKIIPLFLVIAVGVFYRILMGKSKAIEMRKNISELVLYYLLPILTFKTIFEAHLSLDYARVAVFSWSVIISGVLISFVVSKLLSIPDKERVGFIFGATFSNATYLGIPILTAKLGIAAIPTAFFYDFLGLTPALYFFSSLFHSRMQSTLLAPKHKYASLLAPIHSLIKLPPVWAVFLGIIANLIFEQKNVPDVLIDFFNLLGKPVAPLMMISVGLGLSPLKMNELKWVFPGVAIKLLLLPGIASQFAPILNFEGPLIAQASIVEAGLPTMLLTVLVCEKFGFHTKILSQIIVLSTALCAFTLDFW